VHQATTVASVREESGRVIARSVLPTDRGALTEFVRGMRGARHVTFEEGTQAQWLYDVLAPLVDRVIVCDRRGAPRQGNKGDQVDADHLSELLRRGALRAVYHGSADRVTLKELTRTYRNLVEDATRVMLRLKALFRARGIATAGTAVYHPRYRARWLAQLLEGGARFPAAALYAELDVLRQPRPKAKAGMVTEARRDPAGRGPLQDFWHRVMARGTREELARLTLTRKLAALTLRLWKKGERYDSTKLTTPAR